MQKGLSVFTMILLFLEVAPAIDKCHSCDGTGERECDFCNGLGYMGACERCVGSGMLDEMCPKCDGSKYVSVRSSNGQYTQTACPYCHSTGSIRVKCPRCIGTGRNNKCMTCLGTGRVKCRYCGGRGYNLDQKDTSSISSSTNPVSDTSYHNLIVVRQIDFDERTSLSFVAKDTTKPKTVIVIFSSEDPHRYNAVTIPNPYGPDVVFSHEAKTSTPDVARKHKVVGVVELSWNEFEQLIKINPFRIVTTHGEFDLNDNDLEIVFSLHRYLVDRHE